MQEQLPVQAQLLVQAQSAGAGTAAGAGAAGAPATCEDQCKPGGSLGANSLCTANYCDMYQAGQAFHYRCSPSSSHHGWAAAECQATCNICPGSTIGTSSCLDTPGWTNYVGGFGCQGYIDHSWCANGAAVPGEEWTLGAGFNYPERNCCVCGKA